MSAELSSAIHDELHRINQIEDPVERIQVVNDFYAQLDFELDPISDSRLEAVKELRRQGQSYGAIAARTGLSRARAAQLSRMAVRPQVEAAHISPKDVERPEVLEQDE